MARKKTSTSPATRKKWIIALAIFISLVLYFAGVLSGLYANKVIKKETSQDISSLQEETRGNLAAFRLETTQELTALQNYTRFLDANLKSWQLEQVFLETLDESQMCNFSTISLNERIKQLQYYWERLPFRMEEFERTNKPSEDYFLLKKQYTQLSIQTWILARNQYEKCNTDLVQGLYFYSANCTICTSQGEQLDFFKDNLTKQGKQVLIFTVDAQSDEPMIQYLMTYYGISSLPALVINDQVYQGRLYTAEELLP
jgi:hypothetical protein